MIVCRCGAPAFHEKLPKQGAKQAMPKQWRTWIIICLICFAASVQVGRAAKPSVSPGDRLITLYVTADNKAGQSIYGLKKQDFKLLDNQQPQKLVSFRAVEGATADLPVEVILLIDEVNDSFVNVAYAKSQVAKFLQTNGGKLPVPVSLVFFTALGATIGSKPSLNGHTLLTELNQDRPPLHTVFRSQGDYGANARFKLSLRAIEQLTDYEATRPGRKLVIWIGPGWPLLDFPHLDPVEKTRKQIFNFAIGMSSRLRNAGITLYSVDPPGTADSESLQTARYQEFLKGLRDPSQAQHGNLGLQVLAYQSGGQVFTASNDIAHEITVCVSDANAFYALSFKAATADGQNEFHSLEVKIDKPGISARTRSGYYAEQGINHEVSPFAVFEDHEHTAKGFTTAIPSRPAWRSRPVFNRNGSL